MIAFARRAMSARGRRNSTADSCPGARAASAIAALSGWLTRGPVRLVRILTAGQVPAAVRSVLTTGIGAQMFRRRTWIVLGAVVCLVGGIGAIAALADHGGDGRLDGPFNIDGRVKEASGVFRDQEGDRIHRTYFFIPRCPSDACDTTLDRETRGSFYVRSALEHRADPGRYRGGEEASGNCDGGGDFEVRTVVKVHVQNSRDGLARKISGSTETEQDGCADGKQRGTFEGKLALVNP